MLPICIIRTVGMKKGDDEAVFATLLVRTTVTPCARCQQAAIQINCGILLSDKVTARNTKNPVYSWS